MFVRGSQAPVEPLDRALAYAETTGEPRRVLPVPAARAEVAWLENDLDPSAADARPAFNLATRTVYPAWRRVGQTADNMTNAHSLSLSGERRSRLTDPRRVFASSRA